ncbi:glycoside hydrolase family 19 protein [Dietzia sp. NPDC055877]
MYSAAMFAAQIGHESVGLQYMEEIASGQPYEGRSDLGNVHAGDGVRYKGSGPIRLTWRNNFALSSQWANASGHISLDFEAQPHLVRDDPRWGFLAASWYWTVARPHINALADLQDLDGVTRAINGGLNGLADRRRRYDTALRLGARLLPAAGDTVEKRLDYPRDQVRQDTIYNCGPASTQTIIRAATGQLIGEEQLALEMRTTTSGTDWIGQFPAVPDKHLPGSRYQVEELRDDPPTAAQRDTVWAHVTGSIDAGCEMVANIVAPPGNYPRGSNTSTISPPTPAGPSTTTSR